MPAAVHEPPRITALLVSDGEREAAVLACDLLGMRTETARRLRAAAAESSGVDADAIMLACSHSHALPTLDRDFKLGGLQEEWTAANERYAERFAAAIDDALAGARAGLRPARLGTGTGQSGIGVNRRLRLPEGDIIIGRNPDGYVDRTVSVARIDGQDGTAIASLVGFGCHPITLGPEANVVSADYPAAMRHVVEGATGAPCLFLQGAEGDVTVVDGMGGDPAIADRLGRILGHEAAKVWEEIEPRNVEVSYELVRSFNTIQSMHKEVRPDPPARVGARLEAIDIPLHQAPSAEAAEAVIARVEREIEKARADGENEGQLNIRRIERRWAQRALAAAHEGRSDRTPADVQVLAINDLILVGLPVEPLSRTAAILRETIGPAAVCVGCANGPVGYMALPEHFPEGGYEVEAYSRTFGLPGPLAPGASDLILDTAARLAREAAA
jgi:neutral ceramidase